MNTVHPWLDADEVRQLAQRLLQPVPHPPSLPKEDAAFSGQFEGFAANPAESAVTDRSTAPAPEPATRPAISESQPTELATGKQEKSTGLPTIPELPVAEIRPDSHASSADGTAVGSYSSQNHKTPPPPTNPTHPPSIPAVIGFRDWMSERFSATGLFILNQNGEVYFDEGTQGRLHFLARSLTQAQQHPTDVAHHVHVKIGVHSTLEIIPVDVASGRHVLGALVPQPLDQSALRSIIHALERILSTKA